MLIKVTKIMLLELKKCAAKSKVVLWKMCLKLRFVVCFWVECNNMLIKRKARNLIGSCPCLSHDRDTVSGAQDWSIQTQGFIFILKVTASYFKSFLVTVFNYFWECLRMIIGIVFKARWFVRPDINTDVTIIFA